MLPYLYKKFNLPLALFIELIKKRPVSILAVCLISFTLVWKSYSSGSWRNNRSIIHDITSYYSYLPAAFIYQDFKFNYRYDLPADEPVDHLWVNEKGDTVFQKMSIGLSYFYMPTFFIAHWYTLHFTDHNANGFSKPYQMALNMNTLFFGLLSLLVLWSLGNKLFSDTVTAISLILLYLGTNLMYYISCAPGLSHPYSLLLVSLMLLFSIHFYESKKRSYFYLICFVVGLAVLVRPTNAILALFPLIYGLNKNNRVLTISTLRQAKPLLIGAMLFLLPWIPQVVYWKYATGSFIFYSYDQEGFFFNKPHIIEGLIGYRKGWLVYSPMMVLALVGLFVSRSYSTIKKPLMLIFPLFMFVVFSWWCWWYGGSFGSRVMIETYPFLLIGLASFVQLILSKKWYIKLPATFVISFFLLLNFHQTRQYTIGMMHWDSMTKEAYWSIFMEDTPPDNFQDLLEHPDYKKAMIEGE